SWVDSIYLSQTHGVGPSDLPLATENDFLDTARQPILGFGDSYTQSTTIELPPFVTGSWYLVVVPNALGTVFASAGLGVGPVAIPITVKANPAPDLQIASVSAPASVQGGQAIPVTWMVTNQGFASTVAGVTSATPRWSDSVYLSTTPTLQTTGT